MIFLLILILVPITVSLRAERLTISDFSGGINQAGGPLVQENQAADIVDFEFTPIGALAPRKGFKQLERSRDIDTSDVEALIPFGYPPKKHLLVKRSINDLFSSHWSAMYSAIQGDDEDADSTLFSYAFYSSLYEKRPLTGMNAFMWGNNLYLATYGTEPVAYNGWTVRRLRPLAPGQPIAVAADSVGNVTGLVRYKYTFGRGQRAYESNFSAPSFSIQVTDGQVYLCNIGDPFGGVNDTMRYIYRETDNSGYYELLDSLTDSTVTTYTDNIATASMADTCALPYGPTERCFTYDYSGSSYATPPSHTDANSHAPGSIWLTVSTGAADTVSDGYGIACPVDNATAVADSNLCVAYSTVFEDSSGRRSYMGTPTTVCDKTWRRGDYVTLDSIPMPTDDYIKHKLIVRRFGRVCSDSTGDQECYLYDENDSSGCRHPENWYVVCTLAVDTTKYVDSMPACSIHTSSRIYCSEDDATTVIDYEEYRVFPYGDIQEDGCVDSVLTFQPTDWVIRGTQVAAIGDPEYPNTVYLSRSGYPGTWPLTNSYTIESQHGDWFVALEVVGDILLLFRQNSIVAMSGFDYYNINVQEISGRVGTTSPRSVVSSNLYTYFCHHTGVYRLGGQGTPEKISTPIDTLWSTWPHRDVVGTVIDNDYWLSSDSGTLIWDEEFESWRRASFTFTEIVQYDTTLAALDYGTDDYVVLRNDSLWLLFEDDRDGAGSDTTGAIRPEYRSRQLFDGPEREYVATVDVSGWGTVDSLILYSINNLTDTTSTIIIEDVDFSGRDLVRFGVHQIFDDYTFVLLAVPNYSGRSIADYFIRSVAIEWQPWDMGIEQ